MKMTARKALEWSSGQQKNAETKLILMIVYILI